MMGENMNLNVFARLALSGGIEKVIISTDRNDERHRIVVDAVTVFQNRLRLKTYGNNNVRYFPDEVRALETLAEATGELHNVKVIIEPGA